MSTTEELHVLELVIENPGMHLTEMKKELHARGTDVDESTTFRLLKELKFSRKKMRLVAIQQSEELKESQGSALHRQAHGTRSACLQYYSSIY